MKEATTKDREVCTGCKIRIPDSPANVYENACTQCLRNVNVYDRFKQDSLCASCTGERCTTPGWRKLGADSGVRSCPEYKPHKKEPRQ